jgi:hypothetical protein
MFCNGEASELPGGGYVCVFECAGLWGLIPNHTTSHVSAPQTSHLVHTALLSALTDVKVLLKYKSKPPIVQIHV